MGGRKRLDVIGKTFGKLYVVESKDNPKDKKHPHYLCKCECGNAVIRTASNLVRSAVNLCWECRNEFISLVNRKGYKEISGEFWNRVERSARVRNIKLEISIEDAWTLFIKQDRKCALSGVDIRFNVRKEDIKFATASLDRIDSSKGYTLDNIQWVHKTLNNLKMDLDENEFIDWCRKVVEYQNVVREIRKKTINSST